MSPDRPRASRSAQRIAAGAVLGACAALVLGAVSSGISAGGRFTDDPAATGVQPLRAPAHTCLTWQQPDASDARQVSCVQPHLFEVIGTVELADLEARTPFPDAPSWQQLVTSRCTQRTTQALAGRFDPFGRFSVGAIKPSVDSWRRGDRTLRCGVQSSGRSGALFATTGSAAHQDQSDVHPPGTCLGNDGKTVGDPVDCARPHAVEVVGVVDLSAAFPKRYPDETAQDGVLDAECTKLAADFAGGPEVVGKKGLTVFWETLRPQSWQAGSRRVDCRLGAFLPDRSGFAPVTGSVKGPVQVGKQPARPAARTSGPAPVPAATVTTAVTPGPPPR
ncbi:MAG TPA: septum formation family protein [Pseudonocardiaceae bacterium]|nr:septum formation family protein [Pseudonocardiaceae bacterium]